MAKVIMPRIRPSGHYSSGLGGYPDSMPPMIVHHEHSERVLLLEDEEQTNLVLKEYLQSLGYSVVAVSNGVDGLREVMKSDFELVICDMMMPRLPGDMFFVAVQKTRPQLCKRFVFITGHQETPTIGSFIAESEAAILVKPFRLKQLELTLEGILSKFPHRPQPGAQPLRIVRLPEESLDSDSGMPAPAGSMMKKEALPMMVRKALKVVGFLRGNESEMPKPLPAQPVPRVTRRIAVKNTEPATPPPSSITLSTATSVPRTTRRINLRAATEKSEPVQNEAPRPQVTKKIAIQKVAQPPTTIRVAQTPKTTLKVPVVQPLPVPAKKVRKVIQVEVQSASESKSPAIKKRKAVSAKPKIDPVEVPKKKAVKKAANTRKKKV